MARKTSTITALAALLIVGCAQTSERATGGMKSADAEPVTRQGPARYLALGDSYTIGEAVASDQRFPAMLVKRLRSADIKVKGPRIIAKTGWTTDELDEAIDETKLDPPYHLVTLLIGVNNQYRGRSADEYRDEFVGLLERAVELAGGYAGGVVVISIPDWGVTPFARKDERTAAEIGKQIDAFNAINREITEEYGARYVNITDISREVADDILLVANDGLHPSAQQYRRWVDRILPVAKDVLGE